MDLIGQCLTQLLSKRLLLFFSHTFKLTEKAWETNQYCLSTSSIRSISVRVVVLTFSSIHQFFLSQSFFFVYFFLFFFCLLAPFLNIDFRSKNNASKRSDGFLKPARAVFIRFLTMLLWDLRMIHFENSFSETTKPQPISIGFDLVCFVLFIWCVSYVASFMLFVCNTFGN